MLEFIVVGVGGYQVEMGTEILTFSLFKQGRKNKIDTLKKKLYIFVIMRLRLVL